MAILYARTMVYDIRRRKWTKFTGIDMKDKPRTLTAGLQVDNVNLLLNNLNQIDQYPGADDTNSTTNLKTKDLFMGKGLVEKIMGDYTEKTTVNFSTELSVVVKNDQYPGGQKEDVFSASKKTRYMAVIQPGNMSLYARNIARDPLFLQAATLIIKVDGSTTPVAGTYLFRYKADTAKIELSSDASAYSGDFSVTSDGSTVNSDVASTGIDIVLASNPQEGDEFEITVIDDMKTGEDTYIDEATANVNRNYGVDTELKQGISSSKARIILMRFNLNALAVTMPGNITPSAVDLIKGAFLRFRSDSNSPQDASFYFVEISDTDQDWVQGTKDNATAGTNEPDWNHRKHTGSNWGGGVGSVDNEAVALTDTITVNAASTYFVLTGTDQLNILIKEWITLLDVDDATRINNGILSIRTGSGTSLAHLQSSDYSGSVDQKPMLVFIYDSEDTSLLPRVWRLVDLAKKRGRSFYIKIKNFTDISWFRIKFRNIGGRD